MLINGLWYLCDDGVVRPVIRAQVQRPDGSWHEAPFLADTGGDVTVLSAEVLKALGGPPPEASLRIAGVGGQSDATTVKTPIRLATDGGGWATLQGSWTAALSEEALDMSVLGRDILDIFALIVDRPRDVVCLLGQKHHYKIEQH